MQADLWDGTLVEPVCTASLARARPSGSVGLANPDDLEHAFGTATQVSCVRKRLTAKVSPVDGQPWSHARVIEEGAASYSDPAALPEDVLFCLYEAGSARGSGDEHNVTLARFGLDRIRKGRPLR